MTSQTTPGRAYERVQRKLTKQERTALRESLVSHGLRDPITLDQHSDILDGYNREDLCRELGIAAQYRTLEVDDPVHWIRHNQTARRNLGEAEMRELIVEMKTSNPEASTRTIAEKLGTSQRTVARAIKATEPDGSVNRVKGRDGKVRTYTQGTQSQPRSRPVEDKAREAIRDRIIAGTPVKAREAAKEAGISHVMVEQAAAMERARLELLEELGVDPATLSMSAQAKLEVAKRQLEHKLRAEHAARLAQIDETVRQRVVAEGKAYWAEANEMKAKAEADIALYQKWINDRTPIFTETEFFTVLKALDPSIEHQLTKPDAALIKLFNDATVLMNAKRERLTLKKR